MSESWQRDALGNATGRSITGSQGGALSEEWLRDANDELLVTARPRLLRDVLPAPDAWLAARNVDCRSHLPPELQFLQHLQV